MIPRIHFEQVIHRKIGNTGITLTFIDADEHGVKLHFQYSGRDSMRWVFLKTFETPPKDLDDLLSKCIEFSKELRSSFIEKIHVSDWEGVASEIMNA